MTTDCTSYFRTNESHTCLRNNFHIFSHVYDRCWEFKHTVACVRNTLILWLQIRVRFVIKDRENGLKSTNPTFLFTNYDVIFQLTINSGNRSTKVGISWNQIDFARS